MIVVKASVVQEADPVHGRADAVVGRVAVIGEVAARAGNPPQQKVHGNQVVVVQQIHGVVVQVHGRNNPNHGDVDGNHLTIALPKQ